MKLEFNRVNLVYLILVVNIERHTGVFLEKLEAALDKAYNQERRLDVDAPKPPVRATWYNWFKELEPLCPPSLHGSEAAQFAASFAKEHPALVQKYARKFSRMTFECMRDFLIQRGFLGGAPAYDLVASVPDSLYFAMTQFLKPKFSPEGDHISLPGIYRVYRPSLSAPGKVIVSAARVSSEVGGALRYQERMHYHHSAYGWQAQHFQGYIFGLEGRAFLITKDDGSKLPQFSVLKPLARYTDANGQSLIRAMAGSYSGASQKRESDLFSTGIFMVRDKLRTLADHPVEKWKVGHLKTFGLQERDQIPAEVLRHLFE
ncbi:MULTISPECIES: hypothetical protein [Agrobacterium]|uniref:hypothetical protein n=1 Tax=Agrobacterium TaxID=357 RepID=UPI0023006652|nr:MULTISPECIES: hypothetical protein [Agrobacterium]MDA5630862.1 hypothetical protein [Agrobacterium sp. ST15.16.055]MDA6981665.1 hypothetical protein [Agrobacterium salinitolerans]